MAFTSETGRAAGRLGGLAKVRKYGTVGMAEIGSRGGRALVERRGREFMKEIGAKGLARRWRNGLDKKPAGGADGPQGMPLERTETPVQKHPGPETGSDTFDAHDTGKV